MYAGVAAHMAPAGTPLQRLHANKRSFGFRQQAADGLTPLQQIVEQQVCAAFDVSPEEAMKDAESFVQELAAHGILKLSEEPIL